MNTILSVIRPKQPTEPGWRQINGIALPMPAGTFEVWAHDRSGLGVISAVEVASEATGVAPLGPAYHVSVSAFGQRCSSADAQWALAQFDLADAKEDNHTPNGKVRNFWRYVADSLSGIDCSCTETESVIREDKGDYVWRGA